MNFMQVKTVVNEFVTTNLSNLYKMVTLNKNESRWVARVEIIEEPDYLKKLGKGEIVGLYQIELDLEGEIIGYERVHLRERSDLEWNRGE